MKKVSTTVVGSAGLLYSLSAVLVVYRDAPIALQAFIVAGVATTGAAVGWLAGTGASWLRRKFTTDRNHASC